MSPRRPRNDKSPAWPRKGFLLGEQRMKLNYKFAKHVIATFQNSRAGYVKPFLEPVDQEADGASDYYTVIKHPMDLSTMLQELKEGKYGELYDVKRSFDRMFSNCFKYNSSSNDVYRKGLDFRKALYEVWYGIDDRIEAQAIESRHLSEEDVADGSSEAALHDTSDESQMADINPSDEETQEDDESFEDGLPPVRRRRYVSYRETSPDEDTSDEDQTEEPSGSEDETSEDVDFDDCPNSVGRRRYIPNRRDLIDDDDTPTKPEHKNRSQKEGWLETPCCQCEHGKWFQNQPQETTGLYGWTRGYNSCINSRLNSRPHSRSQPPPSLSHRNHHKTTRHNNCSDQHKRKRRVHRTSKASGTTLLQRKA
jgi:hypothetical protein